VRELDLGGERPYLVVTEHTELAIVAANQAGGPRQVGRIALEPGTDAADVGEIENDPERASQPWVGDLLVSDRANARVIRLHRSGTRWQNAGTLPAGAAPTALFAGGVVDSGSNAVSLYERHGGGWRPAGQRSVGSRPVDAVSLRLPDISGGAPMVAVANAESDSISILSGARLSRREDVAVGREPTALDAWSEPLSGSATLAVVNTASASVSVFELGSMGERHSRTVELPGTRPVAVALGKIDRDGRLDLAIADAAGRRLQILYGTADGRFVRGPALELPDEPVGVLAGIDVRGGLAETDDIAVLGRDGVLSVFVAVDDRQLSEAGIGLAAHGGRVLWSASRGDGYRMFARTGDTIQRVRGIGPSREPILARFGRGPGGAPAIAYLRCGGRGCAPLRYEFRSGHEVRIRGIAVPDGCALTDVAIWGRRVAYVLDHATDERRCRTAAIGVWVRDGHCAHHLDRGFHARLGSFTGRRLGWSQWRGGIWNAVATVKLANLESGRVRTLYRDKWLENEFTGPLIDGSAVYWAVVDLNDYDIHKVRLYRQVGSGRDRCRRHVTHTDESHLGIPFDWESRRVDFAIDRDQIYYAMLGTPFAADMARLAPGLACPRVPRKAATGSHSFTDVGGPRSRDDQGDHELSGSSPVPTPGRQPCTFISRARGPANPRSRSASSPRPSATSPASGGCGWSLASPG
jgi:hypothetical protein